MDVKKLGGVHYCQNFLDRSFWLAKSLTGRFSKSFATFEATFRNLLLRVKASHTRRRTAREQSARKSPIRSGVAKLSYV